MATPASAKMLQHVAAHNGIERTLCNGNPRVLNVPIDHFIEPAACTLSGFLIEFNPDDMCFLPSLDRSSKLSRAAADVEDSSSRFRD
jgi:hypothetical protein